MKSRNNYKSKNRTFYTVRAYILSLGVGMAIGILCLASTALAGAVFGS